MEPGHLSSQSQGLQPAARPCNGVQHVHIKHLDVKRAEHICPGPGPGAQKRKKHVMVVSLNMICHMIHSVPPRRFPPDQLLINSHENSKNKMPPTDLSRVPSFTVFPTSQLPHVPTSCPSPAPHIRHPPGCRSEGTSPVASTSPKPLRKLLRRALWRPAAEVSISYPIVVRWCGGPQQKHYLRDSFCAAYDKEKTLMVSECSMWLRYSCGTI